jgi:hypothetical protein
MKRVYSFPSALLSYRIMPQNCIFCDSIFKVFGNSRGSSCVWKLTTLKSAFPVFFAFFEAPSFLESAPKVGIIPLEELISNDFELLSEEGTHVRKTDFSA